MVILNRKTIPSRSMIGSPTIRVSGKSGTISFSLASVQKIDLKSGDALTFIHENSQTYLLINKDENGFEVKEEKEGRLQARNTMLCNQINELNKLEKKQSYPYLIGQKTEITFEAKQTEAYPLINMSKK